MLRHASIYRVTRSCKINQRSSVCQQKATTEKKHMSPFKIKICLFTATKDWKQISSSNVELRQVTGSQKKALAWKKLWWVLSYWETAEAGNCFGAGGKGRWQKIVKGTLYWSTCVFSSAVYWCSQKNFTMHKDSHLAGETSGKRRHINTHKLQHSKSHLGLTSEVFFPRDNWSDVNTQFCLFTFAGNTYYV